MSIFRQYVVPALILVVFLVALVAASARSFLPGDMAAPAPIEGEPVGLVSQDKLVEGSEPLHLGQFYIGQFHLGQFYIGQFYIGQFCIGQFSID